MRDQAGAFVQAVSVFMVSGEERATQAIACVREPSELPALTHAEARDGLLAT